MGDGIDSILAGLLRGLGASRVTLRQDLPGGRAFPVTHEALAPGAGSLRDETTIDLRSQPVAIEVAAGRQVVQDDCASAYPGDGAFRGMLEVYGGLAAQIVTPVVVAGRVTAIVSVHQLGSPRRWSPEEIDACSRASAEVSRFL
jgi:GAF domain-containing protein